MFERSMDCRLLQRGLWRGQMGYRIRTVSSKDLGVNIFSRFPAVDEGDLRLFCRMEPYRHQQDTQLTGTHPVETGSHGLCAHGPAASKEKATRTRAERFCRTFDERAKHQ
jgi:hypothetical protein